MRFYLQLFACIAILNSFAVFAEEPIKENKELRGLVVAKREAIISAGINGKIDKMDNDGGAYTSKLVYNSCSYWF